MTDNRTNEPSEAQVKLAYLAHLKAPRARGMDVYGPMRAALVAAQEAAPQAESVPLHPDEREPIAINPLLRGVDLALDRLIRRDCFTERTLRVIDELREELAGKEKDDETR